MVLASALMGGIYSPDNIQNGGTSSISSVSILGLALVSICEIDVTSFSEDRRGVK
jgi:hypothetical protein